MPKSEQSMRPGTVTERTHLGTDHECRNGECSRLWLATSVCWHRTIGGNLACYSLIGLCKLTLYIRLQDIFFDDDQ